MIGRDKLVKKHGEAAVAGLEASYKNAVTKMLQAPKYTHTTITVPRVDGRGFARTSASASEVARNLIGRTISYDPVNKQNLVMGTHPDGKSGTVTDRAFEKSSGPQSLFQNLEASQTKAWVHEGIHSPEVHSSLGPRAEWESNHQDPFQNAAQDLLEKAQ